MSVAHSKPEFNLGKVALYLGWVATAGSKHFCDSLAVSTTGLFDATTGRIRPLQSWNVKATSHAHLGKVAFNSVRVVPARSKITAVTMARIIGRMLVTIPAAWMLPCFADIVPMEMPLPNVGTGGIVHLLPQMFCPQKHLTKSVGGTIRNLLPQLWYRHHGLLIQAMPMTHLGLLGCSLP